MNNLVKTHLLRYTPLLKKFDSFKEKFLIGIKASYLFNEIWIDAIQTDNEILLLYPFPCRKYYILLHNLSKIIPHDNTKIEAFIYNNKEKINKIFKEVLNVDLILDEDDILSLIFKIIEVNSPEFEENISGNKDEIEFNCHHLHKAISNIIVQIEEMIKNFIKLSKPEIADFFGTIDEGPFRYCSITSSLCNQSCKFFNPDIDCKYSYYNFKYISFKGLYYIVNILSEGYLEDKNFYYKLITGEDLIDKVKNLTVKKKIEKTKKIDDKNEKEEIIRDISKILIKIYKNIDYDLISKISPEIEMIKTKVENETLSPDDLTMDELIKIMIYQDNIFCKIYKYLIYIRDKMHKMEFPYDEDYSLKKAQEEYKTFNELSDEKKKSHRAWSKERFDLFKEGFNENDIIKMKIAYNNYYWAWYKYHLNGMLLSFEDLLTKYIIDKIIHEYTYFYAHGIYIFESKEKIKKLKETFKKLLECDNNIDLLKFIVPGEIYLINLEKIKEIESDKSEKYRYSFNPLTIIKNKEKLINDNIINKIDEQFWMINNENSNNTSKK